MPFLLFTWTFLISWARNVYEQKPTQTHTQKHMSVYAHKHLRTFKYIVAHIKMKNSWCVLTCFTLVCRYSSKHTESSIHKIDIPSFLAMYLNVYTQIYWFIQISTHAYVDSEDSPPTLVYIFIYIIVGNMKMYRDEKTQGIQRMILFMELSAIISVFWLS